jgi:hypothetical protein
MFRCLRKRKISSLKISPLAGKNAPGEPDAVKQWRKRMSTSEADAVMKRRGRIERVNAQSKNRGLAVMLVRGLEKVQAVATLHALAHNLATALRLRKAQDASIAGQRVGGAGASLQSQHRP